MKYSKFPYEQEEKAKLARAVVQEMKLKLEKQVELAKSLCHWLNGKICMCPGKNFQKCGDLSECYGYGAFDFEESES